MRGRRAAWIGAALAAFLCVGVVYALRGRILEEWWIAQLGSNDDALVRSALERLGAVRSRRAIPHLAELYKKHEVELRSSETGLATTVIETAVMVGAEALAPILEVAFLERREDIERLLAERWESTLPVLLELIKDDRSQVISISARSLQKIDDPEALPKLRAALDDPSRRVRFAAAWALTPSHPRLKAVRELLVASLKDPSPAVRIEAASAIHSGSLHPASREVARHAAPALVEAMLDREADVRRHAAWPLGFSGCEEAAPALVAALEDADTTVAHGALTALSNLGNYLEPSVERRLLVPRLLEKFHGSDPRAVWIAAKALTSFGLDARAVWPELLEYWKGLPENEYELLWTVRRLGPKATQFVPQLLEKLHPKVGGDPDHAIMALEAIGPGAGAAAPDLLQLLRRRGDDSSNGWTRFRVQTALPAICPDGEGVLPELLSIVADSSESDAIRSSAAITLGGFRGREAATLPALQRLLEDPGLSPKLRVAAAEGLGRLGRAARNTAPAMEVLRKVAGVRGGALVGALWQVEPRKVQRVVRYLVKSLEQSDETYGLARVLEEIGPAALDAVPVLIRHLKTGRNDAYADSPAETLWRIGKPAVPALAEALRSDDVAVRSQSAEILGWIGPAAEEAIPQLTAALDDEDAEVRRDAAKSLPKVSALRDLHQAPKLPPGESPRLSSLLSDADGSAISSSEAWSRLRRELLAEWLVFLGGLPDDRGPLEMQVIETDEPTKFTRQLVRYRIEDGVTAEAYLLTPWDLPADGSKTVPGIVVFHSTVDSSAGEPAGLDPSRSALAIGVQLVEKGHVCLCPRNFIFDDGADYAGNVAKMAARHPGRKGMARMLLDAQRAADVLESLPYVDRGRIGCIGHSLGAKEALYAAAFDERFRAAVFHEGGVGLGMSNWDAVWYLGPQIREPSFPREHHELLALVAPRAFLLIAGGEADNAQSWPYVEAALPVYRLFGADSRFGWVVHTGGHNYTRFARGTAEEFLERHLR